MAGKELFGICRRCGNMILWVNTKAGKHMPVNPKMINYKEVIGGKEKIFTPSGVVVMGEKCGVDDAKGCGYIPHFVTCVRR